MGFSLANGSGGISFGGAAGYRLAAAAASPWETRSVRASVAISDKVFAVFSE
jgi:hypothetical protein